MKKYTLNNLTELEKEFFKECPITTDDFSLLLAYKEYTHILFYQLMEKMIFPVTSHFFYKSCYSYAFNQLSKEKYILDYEQYDNYNNLSEKERIYILSCILKQLDMEIYREEISNNYILETR